MRKRAELTEDFVHNRREIEERKVRREEILVSWKWEEEMKVGRSIGDREEGNKTDVDQKEDEVMMEGITAKEVNEKKDEGKEKGQIKIESGVNERKKKCGEVEINEGTEDKQEETRKKGEKGQKIRKLVFVYAGDVKTEVALLISRLQRANVTDMEVSALCVIESISPR